MPNFRVAIFQTSSQIFIVEADNRAKAIEKISDAWDNGIIDLDNPDISDTDFSLIGHAEENARSVL
jgi:hypothetical protein